MVRKILKYVIPSIIAIGLFFLVFSIRKGFETTDQKELYKYLCDATFVPGIAFIGVGLLVITSNGGVFDMLIFGVMKLFSVFKKDPTDVKYRTFYDYKVAMEDHKTPYAQFMIIGAVFGIASVIFLLLYYR